MDRNYSHEQQEAYHEGYERALRDVLVWLAKSDYASKALNEQYWQQFYPHDEVNETEVRGTLPGDVIRGGAA